MRRNKSYQRGSNELNVIEKLYWCRGTKKLYVGLSMENGNMMYGIEWAAFCNDYYNNNSYFQGKNKLVHIYSLMKSFDCGSMEEEAEVFQKIADLYLSEDKGNVELVVQMLDGAAEKVCSQK